MFRISLTFSLLLVFQSVSLGQQPDLALARVISDGYQKNRALLRSIKCKFTYATGTATSPDGGIAGEFTSDRCLICNWLTRDNFEKWETFPSLDGTTSSIAEQQEVVFLRNAKTTLVYHPRDRSANLRPPGTEPWPNVFTPLNLMIMAHDERLSPAACIEKALAGEMGFKEILRKTIENKPCYELAVFDSNEAHANLITMTIDPALGFLPVKLTIATPHSIIECRILETKQLPNGAWFPMSSRLGIRPNMKTPTSKTLISSIQVLEISTSPAPSDEDFSMTLDKDTEVLNVSDGTRFFRVSEDQRVLAKGLNELVDYTEKMGKWRKAEAKALGSPYPDSEIDADTQLADYSYRAIMATALIFTVIVLACLLFLLLRRKS